MTAPTAALFIPPAVTPADKDPPLLLLAARTPGNQIEGWPRAVFEAEIYRPTLPGTPHYIMEPRAIRTVLLDAAEDFPQGALFKRMMRPAWGRGMLTAEGRDWRAQRHAAAGAFRPADIGKLTPLISRAVNAHLDRWRSGAQPVRIEISEAMATITFDIIVDTMLSGAEDFDRARMRSRMQAFFADIGRMRLSYFLAPDAYHASRPEHQSAHRAPLLAEVMQMIRRRRGVAARNDLVDLLFKARDPETGQGLDDELLADNLLGFMLAGHETTALALTWALYLVAAHPATARRIRDEVARVAGQSPIGTDHIEHLVFTRQVISEAMRLYPPAYVITRVARRDTQLAGMAVKAGARIIVPIYALHRHRRHWTNPDAFDPDRFAPGAPPPDRYVYLPFGAGPRICIGAAFAMIEAVTALATMVRGAEFTLESGHKVWPVGGLALRPKGGMPMQVQAVAD